MTLMTILGYIMIGLIVGWLSRQIYGERGVTMMPSLAFGVLGSMTATLIIYLVGLAGAGFYALMGAMAMIFTVNTFRQKEPIFEEVIAE